MNQTTKKWEKVYSYGGKLAENIVQAIARDCLAFSMLRLSEEGHELVMHVHDEAIDETPKAEAAERLDNMLRIMSEEIPWAPGLPLKAEGFISDYYKKE